MSGDTKPVAGSADVAPAAVEEKHETAPAAHDEGPILKAPVHTTGLVEVSAFFFRPDRVAEYDKITNGLFSKVYSRQSVPVGMVSAGMTGKTVFVERPPYHVTTDKGGYDLAIYLRDPRAPIENVKTVCDKLGPTFDEKLHPGIPDAQLSEAMAQAITVAAGMYSPKDLDTSRIAAQAKVLSGTFDGGESKPPYITSPELGLSGFISDCQAVQEKVAHRQLRQEMPKPLPGSDIGGVSLWDSWKLPINFNPVNLGLGLVAHGAREAYAGISGGRDTRFLKGLIYNKKGEFNYLENINAIPIITGAFEAAGAGFIGDAIESPDMGPALDVIVIGGVVLLRKKTGSFMGALYELGMTPWRVLAYPWERWGTGGLWHNWGLKKGLAAPFKIVALPAEGLEIAGRNIKNAITGRTVQTATQTATNLADDAARQVTTIVDEAMQGLDDVIKRVITANPTATAEELRKLIDTEIVKAVEHVAGIMERIGIRLTDTIVDDAMQTVAEKISTSQDVVRAFAKAAAAEAQALAQAAQALAKEALQGLDTVITDIVTHNSKLPAAQLKALIEEAVKKAVEAAGARLNAAAPVVEKVVALLTQQMLRSKFLTELLTKVGAPVLTTLLLGAGVKTVVSKIAAGTAGPGLLGADIGGGMVNSGVAHDAKRKVRHGSSRANAVIAGADTARTPEEREANFKEMKKAWVESASCNQQILANLSQSYNPWGDTINYPLARGLNWLTSSKFFDDGTAHKQLVAKMEAAIRASAGLSSEQLVSYAAQLFGPEVVAGAQQILASRGPDTVTGLLKSFFFTSAEGMFGDQNNPATILLAGLITEKRLEEKVGQEAQKVKRDRREHQSSGTGPVA